MMAAAANVDRWMPSNPNGMNRHHPKEEDGDWLMFDDGRHRMTLAATIMNHIRYCS